MQNVFGCNVIKYEKDSGTVVILLQCVAIQAENLRKEKKQFATNLEALKI